MTYAPVRPSDARCQSTGQFCQCMVVTHLIEEGCSGRVLEGEKRKHCAEALFCNKHKYKFQKTTRPKQPIETLDLNCKGLEYYIILFCFPTLSLSLSLSRPVVVYEYTLIMNNSKLAAATNNDDIKTRLHYRTILLHQ